MVRIDIPRSYYSDGLPKSSHADALEAVVEPPVDGARGVARLKLCPHSAGLTNIRVSVTTPRCTIGAPSASPRPPDLTASLPGTRGRCAWRHGLVRRGEPVIYEVPITTSDTNTLRFEFRLQADELEQPVILTVDMAATATKADGAATTAAKTAPKTAPKTKPAKGGSQAGSS